MADIVDYSLARKAMVETQIATAGVTDTRLLAAFRRVPREQFLPPSRHTLAYSDAHHPLGRGRFLPAPAVLARLLQLAEISESDRVLECWPATGYSTAIIASVAKDVVAIEPDPELARLARENVAALSIKNANVLSGDLHIPATGPFDLVIIEGAVTTVPPVLLEALPMNGRLVSLVRRGPTAVATVHQMTPRGLSVRTAFNATLPGVDAAPAAEAFVF